MTETIVEARDVDVRFGAHRALQSVSVEIRRGNFVAVLGPNGSGKSTFIRTVLGTVCPSSGQIKVFGRNPVEVPAERIGYVPQIKTFDRSFPALSVDLVISGLRRAWPGRRSASDVHRAEQSLRDVGADHLANRRIGTLSGGELQRVYLARSLVRCPDLLLLDEPATGIDVAGESDLYQVLDRQRSNADLTIVMVTHDWEAAFHHASKILLLNSVQIAFGEPQAALTEASLREAFGHVGHAHAIYGGN